VLGCAELRLGDRGGHTVDGHLADCWRPFFAPAALRQVFRPPEMRRAVSDAEEELRRLYERMSGLPFQKAWQFDLFVIDRVKVVFPRYLAFGGRPALPFADRTLLETIAGIPPEHLAERRMERELLIRRFPRLASIAADRNRRAPTPPIGIGRALWGRGLASITRLRALKAYAVCRLETPWRRLKDRVSGHESRFYYRILDANGPAWRRLRSKAVKGRPILLDWFDEKTLDRWLPGPGETLAVRDGIYHAQRTRLLVGLALWAERVFA
jgi:hypothetical protein